jgi:NADPH:quinone reductase-like Zn-dependent oxidoreductase
MHLAEVAKPIIKDHEVLVEIHAASVNQVDVKIRNGEFKLLMPYKLPFIIGHDSSDKLGAKAASSNW